MFLFTSGLQLLQQAMGKTAIQAINRSTWTKATNMAAANADTLVSNDEIVVQGTGTYTATGSVAFPAGSGGDNCRIVVNGSTVLVTGTAATTTTTCQIVTNLNENDLIRLEVYTTALGSSDRNVQANNTFIILDPV